jgi:WD40 repeat protein
VGSVSGLQPHRVIGRHETDISALRLVDSGEVAVSGDSDGAVNLWDVVNGTPLIEEIRLSPAAVVNDIAALRVSGELVYVVGSDAGLYTVHLGASVRITRVDKHPVTTISVLEPDGQIVTGDRDGRLRLWRLSGTLRLVWSGTAHPEGVISTGTGMVDGLPVVISAMGLPGDDVLATDDGLLRTLCEIPRILDTVPPEVIEDAVRTRESR